MYLSVTLQYRVSPSHVYHTAPIVINWSLGPSCDKYFVTQSLRHSRSPPRHIRRMHCKGCTITQAAALSSTDVSVRLRTSSRRRVECAKKLRDAAKKDDTSPNPEWHYTTFLSIFETESKWTTTNIDLHQTVATKRSQNHDKNKISTQTLKNISISVSMPLNQIRTSLKTFANPWV